MNILCEINQSHSMDKLNLSKREGEIQLNENLNKSS
jgi:hypothetical protein